MNAADAELLLENAATEPSRRIVARLVVDSDCTDNVFDLVAAVYKKAIRDAKRGDVEAIEFLSIVCPDWQELSNRHSFNRRFTQ